MHSPGYGFEPGRQVHLVPVERKVAPVPGASSPENSTAWFSVTAGGYFDCSADALSLIWWNVNGRLYPAERYLRRFRRPDLLRRALAGERITAPPFRPTDLPPKIRFKGLKNGQTLFGKRLQVTVETTSIRPLKAIELLVNGRPLTPEEARPITTGAKAVPPGAKPITQGAKAAAPKHAGAQQYTYSFALPQGVPEVRLRAVGYDLADIGSDPVELVLKCVDPAQVTGRLYVLAVGVSNYQHADGKGLKNLRFPARDAQAVAERFRKEGPPLYESVEVRVLADQQATADAIRGELKRLQDRVRPGQVDTVVLFLSGHGLSKDGKYFFAPHDLELERVSATSVTGAELRQALGGSLRAKNVFLFIDTCHSGGLAGRNDDLALEVGEGVYVLASSGAREYSFESPEWGHGAFTLALLRSLERREEDGVIRFNTLTYAVPNQVAALMKAAGRNEGEQAPCIPRAVGNLRAELASSRP